MKHILINSEISNCSGCGACISVCPKKAITMATNVYGHRYASVDENICIECKKCIEVCSYHTETLKNIPIEVYAAVGKNDELVKNSASGGLFASLANSLISKGGMVVGAVLECADSEVKVYHVLSEGKDAVADMQGSKYVQSDAWISYDDVAKAVKAGKKVLFSGTPCQVAAVKKLTGDSDNLITIDIICHGVPSLQMLNDFCKILSKRLRGKISGLNFRDKSCGKAYTARIEIVKRDKRLKYYLQSHYLSFYKMFLECVSFRESCYSCQYASIERASDITIGDYWGIKEFHSDDISSKKMSDREDWSCLLVNTEKGRLFLDEHKDCLLIYPSILEWVKKNNRQLNAPSLKPDNREDYLNCYKSGGYDALEKRFIEDHGGKIIFHWRMLKNIFKLRKKIRQ